MTQEIIKIENLTKKYATRLALDKISLSINEGEVLGILGPNGAGKTTLVSIISTLRNPSSGSVFVKGYDAKKNKREIRELLGIVFQESSLDKKLTINENLVLHAYLFGATKQDAIKSADGAIKDFKLDNLRNRVVENLSGGEKQRVEIAKCLVHTPQLFIFDEPTVGLDPEVRLEIWDKIKNIAKNKKNTILITSHYLEEIEKLCDRVVILNKGKIVLIGSISELKDSSTAKVEVSFKKQVKKKELEKILGFSVSASGTKYIIDSSNINSINQFVEKLSNYGLDLETIETKKQTLESLYLKIIGDEQCKA